MILSSLAFLLGVVAVQQLVALPNGYQLAGLAVLAGWLAYQRAYLPLFMLLGVLWASLFGMWQLATPLPKDAENIATPVEGYISSLPQQQDDRVSFDFTVTQPAQHFPTNIRLTWYYPKQPLMAGQNWRFNVKLKPPHGRMNPGGFDFTSWLFANHIAATGYVRDKPPPLQLGDSPGLPEYFARWRQSIATRLDAALPNSSQLGVIKALTIGTQDAISQQQWEIFRTTGTTHLVVISGSHISLIAGLFYLWARRGWAWLGILRIAPQQVAAGISWLAGLFYAGLAGYSVPTLRAIIMLSVALLAISWQRNTSAWQILMLALLAVLVFDPLAVLAVGFWLSFVAVALLLYVSIGRLGKSAFWRENTLAQFATFIGLSPLLMVFFQQVSLISPLTNLVAVPIIGVLVVPLALLGILLLFISTTAASQILTLTDWILQGLWWLLTKAASIPLASVYCLPPPWYAIVLATVGVVLLLAPRGIPARYLSVLLFLPAIFVNTPKPPPGNVWLTLLDVGQGLAVVVRTTEHSLVFDTGAKFSEESDMGEAVILPYLRRQGIANIDTLVISHADNDHSGGAAALETAIKITQELSSAIPWATGNGKDYCRAGQSWEWENVKFAMLSPPDSAFDSENDNSCVLRIQAGSHSFLLTGDIEKSAENWLVKEYGKDLQTSVLIAPHHGSKTSSSLAFLQAVNPKLILIPSGFLNRFHFPSQAVISRYQQLALPWLNTAEQGAITIKTIQEQLQVETELSKQRRYWHSMP